MGKLKDIISIPEAGVIIILVCLMTFFQVINPVFLSSGNIAGILRAMPLTGIVAIGLAICLISGTMDISVGATAGLAATVFARLITLTEIPIILCGVLGVAIGIVAGLFNSFIIVNMKVSPFIATISTMYVFRGLATFISNGKSIYPLPEEISTFGRLQPLGLSWSFFIFVALLLVAWYMLDGTVWGLSVRATGSDKESAFCCEVNVKFIQKSAIVIAGGLSALAGILSLTVIGSSVPTIGTGWELIAIAGCAVGGVSLFGYSGSMIGLFCGLLTLQVINNGIITIGVSPYLQVVFIGFVLLISMVLDVRRRTFLNIDQI